MPRVLTMEAGQGEQVSGKQRAEGGHKLWRGDEETKKHDEAQATVSLEGRSSSDGLKSQLTTHNPPPPLRAASQPDQAGPQESSQNPEEFPFKSARMWGLSR